MIPPCHGAQLVAAPSQGAWTVTPPDCGAHLQLHPAVEHSQSVAPPTLGHSLWPRLIPEHTLSDHEATPVAVSKHGVWPEATYSWRPQPELLLDQEQLQNSANSPAQLQNPPVAPSCQGTQPATLPK